MHSTNIKALWNDYEFKKKKSEKFLRIYNAIPEIQRWKGGETLLKKAEKWQTKAQVVLAKFENRNKKDDTNNTNSSDITNISNPLSL